MWHLPLFFIDGTAQAHIPLTLFLLSVVAMSIVLAWLVTIALAVIGPTPGILAKLQLSSLSRCHATI